MQINRQPQNLTPIVREAIEAIGPQARAKQIVLDEKLIGVGKAYRCFCTKEELDAQREALKARDPKAQFVYPGTCRNRSDQPDKPFVVRFKSPADGVTEWNDKVFGLISTPNKSQQDFVLVRTDGYPLYNLAATVDDHEMQMTLVARARDHIGNTPQQILLYRAFGWEPPEFGHLPMMLSSKGEKLSKRNGSVSVKEYRDKFAAEEALAKALEKEINKHVRDLEAAEKSLQGMRSASTGSEGWGETPSLAGGWNGVVAWLPSKTFWVMAPW